MNPVQAMQAFLRDGYQRYAEARDAVSTFERQIQERLMLQFEHKSDWVTFKPRRGERGRGKAVAPGLWDSAGSSPAIYAANGDEDGNSIELGIRWGRHDSGRPYLYTTRWEPRFRKMYLPDAKPPVKNRDGQLIVLVEDDFNFEAMAELLLVETDRALGLLKKSS